jgi:3-oxoacyl-[acyl-carrier-protein] synthase II
MRKPQAAKDVHGDPIVVTGMGALGAGADSPAGLYATAVRGESPATWIDLPGVEQPLAASRAPDPEFVGAELRWARRLDRAAQLGLGAASQAIAQAGLDDAVDRTEIGVIVGTSRGPLARTLETAQELERGAVAPTASAESTIASLSGVISQVFSFGASSATLTATCASAANAIAFGAIQLLAGEAEAMVVGGAEASLVPLLAAQLRAARVTGWDDDPTRTCKPFDVNRNGLMIGEGAAMLVLERASSAERRGATALARLTGWGLGSDDGGRTGVTADGEGLVRVMRRALARAAIDSDTIGYVNAHGTATRLNDPVEARALNSFFGEGRVPPVSSTKPVTGHCLGATPALEAVIAIESLRNSCLPPTANHGEIDPECAIDVISGSPRARNTSAVLSTSLGFWGVQAALIFESV